MTALNFFDRGPKPKTPPRDDIPEILHQPRNNRTNGSLPILSPAAPLPTARELILRHHIAPGGQTLHHQSGEFLHWTGTHYAETEPEQMKAQVYAFLDTALRKTEDGKLVPYQPTRAKVGNVMDALAAAAQLPSGSRSPAWLDNRQAPPPTEIVACRNGLLHMQNRRQLLAHTPLFFGRNALPFDYDPHAPEPMAWLKFLAELWPDDPDAIAALQEMAGLFLTGEMRHQKAFLIVGPKRSGKGTIARVLTQLLGPANVCGPTLSSLGQNFGLAPLIGKRLAVISDARLGGKVDQQVVVERLLAITGEDGIDVDRKFRDTWTGRLEVRFLVLSNELPRLSDASGAVASRFIVLTLRNSFYGKEDHGLIDKLTGELPGILRWALVGWDRLRTRGYFVPPASSAAAQQEMEDLNSPIGAFLRDHCNIGPHHSELCEQTYHRWCDWCEAQGRDHPGTAQTFGRDLRAYLPAITTVMPRDASTGRQHRYYQGLGIKL